MTEPATDEEIDSIDEETAIGAELALIARIEAEKARADRLAARVMPPHDETPRMPIQAGQTIKQQRERIAELERKLDDRDLKLIRAEERIAELERDLDGAIGLLRQAGDLLMRLAGNSPEAQEAVRAWRRVTGDER